MLIRQSNQHATQRGLTLIELLVGIALGILLVGIMGTMYLTSKLSFNTNTQVARVQENIRFAAQFLQRDIRTSSFSECGATTELRNRLDQASDFYAEATTRGVFGWEFSNSASDDSISLDYTQLNPDASRNEVISARNANAGSANDWQDANGNSLPDLIAGFNPLQGSDILMLASEYKTDIVLDNVLNTADPVLQIDSGGANIGRGHIVKVGGCLTQEKFQNSSAANGQTLERSNAGLGGFQPANNGAMLATPWRYPFTEQDPVFAEVLKIYYVGTGTAGLPSLFRYTSECGLSPINSGCSEIENAELIEGIENLQVAYGEDVDNDGTPDVYRTAAGVADFAAVVAVRIGILARSIQATEDLDAETYTLLDEITVDPPDLRLIRYANNMTLFLRNRGGARAP